MTATIDADALPELELTEVQSGPPARAVLAAGGLAALFVLYALYGALTGNLGVLTLLLLALGIGGLFYVYKQVDGAESGELKDLKDKMANRKRQSTMPEPSVRVAGGLLDI